MKFYEKFKEARLKISLSKYALAKKAGVNKSTITRLEQGKFRPTLENYFKFCEILNIPSDLFLQDIQQQKNEQTKKEQPHDSNL